MITKILRGVVLSMWMTSSAFAAVWYVSSDGMDTNSGQSWASAFATLQKAVDMAQEDDEIWIKMGIYQLATSVNVYKAVAIYGGFNGTETTLEERDWQNNLTFLDGQNSVPCMDITASARVDGLRIVNGNNSRDGGGISINNFGNAGNPTVANCTFSGNTAAGFGGGGLFTAHADTIITNCIFEENEAEIGGGIYVYEYGDGEDVSISYCTFNQNSVSGSDSDGGALYVGDGAIVSVNQCSFTNNTSI